MRKSMKYGLAIVAVSALGGYFMMTSTEHASMNEQTSIAAQGQPKEKVKQSMGENPISPPHVAETTVLKESVGTANKPTESKPAHEEPTTHPIERHAPTAVANADPENIAKVSLLPDANPSVSEKAQVESDQKKEPAKASGHFGTVQSSIQFHSTVINALHIDKDHLITTLSSISAKKFSQGKGHFYTIPAMQSKFSGNIPAMALMTQDDYDHYMAIVADTNREKQGYIFHFPFDKWQKTTDYDELTKLLNDEKLLQKNIKLILVRGHTDSMGPGEYNLQLSAERAKTIAKAFPDVPLILEAVGEKEPVADNNSPHGMELNRRAEIIFIMKKPDEVQL